MKKLLSLTLVIIITLCSVAFTACQTQSTTPLPSESESAPTTEPKTPANTTSPKETTSEASTTPAPTTEKPSVDISAIEKLLSTAVNNTLGLTSLSSYIEENYKEIFDDDTFYQTKSTADVLIEDMSNPNSPYSAVGYQEDDGEKIPMFACHYDQYLYLDADGIKLKMTADEAKDFQATDVYEISNEYRQGMKYTLISLPKNILEASDIKEENGNTVISTTITDSQFKELYKEYTDAAIENITYGEKYNKATFSDISITVKISAEQYIAEYTIKFQLEVICDEFTTTTIESKTIVINNPGESVKISEPENADEFLTIKEFYIAIFREMDWKAFGAEYLNLNVSTWDEFISLNNLDEESFQEIMGILTWEEFKEILLEDI